MKLLQKSMGQLEKPSRFKGRREIARINTFLNIKIKRNA